MAKTPLLRLLQQAARASVTAPVSRRQFIKGVGGAIATYPIAKQWPTWPTSTLDPIIILGAGVAGLTAAYALQKAGIPYQLYEASTRVGGRMLTVYNFNGDGQFAEAGAELVDSGHVALNDLIYELGLRLEDISSTSGGLEQYVFYNQGQRYYDNDFYKDVKPFLKQLKQQFINVFPDEPLGITYNSATRYPNAKLYDDLSLAEYLDQARSYTDKWVLNIIRSAYESEFGLDAAEQSSLNLFFLMANQSMKERELMGESDESYRIKGGSEALTTALYNQLPIQNVFLNYKLIALQQKSSDLICTFDTPAGTLEVKGKQVICTMPFTALRNVGGIEQLALSPVKLQCIQDVGYGTNTKLILGFEKRFWRKKFEGVKASIGSICGDFQSQYYWEGSREQKGKSGIMINFLAGKLGANPGPHQELMALQDLDSIYTKASKLFDGRVTQMKWAEQPFIGGSYACLKVGQHTTLCGSAAETELGGQLLFAGEHTSLEYQGYMNGAVESALRATTTVINTRAGISSSLQI